MKRWRYCANMDNMQVQLLQVMSCMQLSRYNPEGEVNYDLRWLRQHYTIGRPIFAIGLPNKYNQNTIVLNV